MPEPDSARAGGGRWVVGQAIPGVVVSVVSWALLLAGFVALAGIGRRVESLEGGGTVPRGQAAVVVLEAQQRAARAEAVLEEIVGEVTKRGLARIEDGRLVWAPLPEESPSAGASPAGGGP